VLAVVRISLPHTIVYSAVYWLGQQGIASQIEDIQINVTEGTFAIINASGIKDGETVFNIGRASIDWQWRPLSKKTMHVKEVVLENFDMKAIQYSDAVVIAGVTIKQGSSGEAQPEEKEQPVAWGAALDQIDFKKLAFCFEQFENALDDVEKNKLIDYCGNIDLLSWQGKFDFGNTGTPPQEPATILSADGTFKIEKLNMYNNMLGGALINIDDALFSDIRINGISDIHLDAVNINQFSFLQGSGHSSHQHAVEFNALDITGITLNDINTLAINSISLDKPVASVAKDDAGAWKFEQWLLQQAKTTSSPEPEPESEASKTNQSSFRLMLGDISVTDAEACYQQPALRDKDGTKAIDYCLALASTNWKGSIEVTTPSDNQPVQLNINGDLNTASISTSNNIMNKKLLAVSEALLSGIKVEGINTIHLDAININQLALLQDGGHSRHKHAVEFNKLDISDITLNDIKALEIKAISLEKPVVSAAKNDKGAWTYEQWLLQQAEASASPVSEPETKTVDNSTFDLKLGKITIADAEVCYQQPALTGKNATKAIDYCINLAQTAWQGQIDITTPTNEQPVKLDINGDLGLASFNTINNILNRDLLTFKNLAINKLRIKGVEDLAFNKLDLDNIAGLELTSAENKHTITVSKLDVSSFNYRTNALAIGKAAITDLGLDITQNQDGTLDFEQWKIESADETTTEKQVPVESKDQPFKIKLDELKLDTTRIVQFTDLSVTPSMQIGFKEIHFNIKDLDSDKPQQKSPIELAATTALHGTLEIKGVAMPFDSKPSFDATGKITGVDLRVVSPKAEQAIGHIIKSGQLDADLKLLSKQGQLDSNIALVLHHFTLKAKSKEDAAALDETFGMPINQSLALLKDKKGRIKLDIPITGDINDPNFDPTNAIIKATTKATTVTLITFYTPYGLAFAGGNVLLNLATALNFDPLVFEAGSSQLNDDHKQQLAKLAELLVERPHVHLTLCGYTNLNDRDKLFTEIIDRKKIKPVSAERLTKLKQLGSERQDAIKEYLINVGKITHDRLILCEPEHSDEVDSLGGVEISI